MIVCISEDAFLLANGRNQMKTWNLKANKLELIEIQESMGFIQSICCIRRESAPVALAIGTRFNYILMKPMKNDQFDVVVRVRLLHSGSIDSLSLTLVGTDECIYWPVLFNGWATLFLHRCRSTCLQVEQSKPND